MKRKTGLFFGTFNPIHVGHLIIANHFAEFTDLEEVWLVVTPKNPFKKKQSLLADHHRFEMVFRATEEYPTLRPSKVEFDLPQPNYTSHTLAVLEEKHPEKSFSLILGEDNLRNFHKWKNYEVLIERCELFVYPRALNATRRRGEEASGRKGEKAKRRVGDLNEDYPMKSHPKVHFVEAPMLEISASFIRSSVKTEKNVRPLLPFEVWKYLDEMNFYK